VRSTQSFLLFAALVSSGTSAVAEEHGQMQMEMQPGADRMKVSVRSPSNGSRITGDNVTLQEATSGYTNRWTWAGKPVQPGTGHYHLLLDKSRVDMYSQLRPRLQRGGQAEGARTQALASQLRYHGGPMMGMMTMAGMTYERTLHASTAGLKPGSAHKLIVLLADNAHGPIMPAVADSVTVKVN
jgi:hypothetical protein